MKTFMFATLLLSLTSVHAAEVLLDCNTPAGPDQQVTVIQDGGSLKLRELTNRGSIQERKLTKREWNSGKLKLREEYPGEVNLLSKVEDGWFLTLRSPGFNFSGYADCF